jgi:tight adherence protein B
MKLRSALALLILSLLAAWPATAAGAEGSIKLVRSPAKFPDRAFVMTLPEKIEPRAGLVTVTENGVPVEHVALTPTNLLGTPAGTVLLIDASNSMRGEPIVNAITAARIFAGRRRENQALAVMTFNREVIVRLPFTSDGTKISQALATTPPLAEDTRFYDGVDQALALVKRSGRPTSSIIVLSDGKDIGSTKTPDELVRRARQQGVRIFTVGLTSKQFDPQSLQQLATSTGGSYSAAASPAELAAIYDKLGSRIANEYLVEYQSFVKAGTRVEVRVRVAGGDTASATYRTPTLPIPVAVTPAFKPSILSEIMQSPLTMLVFALFLATLIAVVVALLVRPKSSGLRERLGAFVAVGRTEDGRRQTALLSERLLEGTERSLGRMRWWSRFKLELEIAEITLPPEQIIVLTTIGTVLLLWVLSLFVSTAFALLAFLTPLLVRMYIRFRAERQRRLFADQLPDNLQVLASALRAGHSLIGALSVVVDDAPEPSQREFRQVVGDEQLGVPLEETLTNVAVRMNNRDLEQVALVAALQRETGGNSAEVLDRVADTVRERAALRRLVRTLTAQGRMARWIVSALPVMLLVVISLLNPAYMSPLYHQTAGQALLALAAIMIVSGSLVIRKIVNIKV